YTTPPLSLYDIGTNVYTVRVSAGGVFAVSEPAELTVAAPPPEPATAYSRRVLEDGALLYWNFDEFTGDADQLAPRDTQLPVRAENDLVPTGGGARISHAEAGSGLRLGNAADLNGEFYQNLNPRLATPVLPGAYAIELWFQSTADDPRA